MKEKSEDLEDAFESLLKTVWEEEFEGVDEDDALAGDGA